MGASGSSVINLRRASDRAAWLAPFTDAFQLRQIVRARMQFEKSVQLALALGELQILAARRQPRRPQPRGGSAQRIALRFEIFDLDEALLLERSNHARGVRQLLLQIRRRERPCFEQAQHLQRRIVFGRRPARAAARHRARRR